MRSELRSILRPAAWCAAVLLTCGGCSRTMLDSSVADTHGGADVTSELDFWDGLALQDAVSNRDALHALLLTFELLPTEDANDEEAVEAAAEGEAAEHGAPAQVEAPAGFDAELAVARERGWIGEGDAMVANETAEVGWIARAVCIEAEIKGGVNMRLFGPIERYALRELTYEGLMGTKSENQALSGLELMATIGRIGDRRTGLVSAPRQDF